MSDFVVDMERCIRCGACVETCGRRALADSGDGSPVLGETGMTLCNACGHCSAICLVGAVTSPKCGGQKAGEIPSLPAVSYETARKFILSCRSMRRFKQESVDQETVLELLDVARRAPTASNRQELRWKAFSGREKAEKFTALTMDWFDKEVRKDPDMSARYNIDGMLARHKNGDDPILRGALNAVICLSDASEGWGTVDGSIAATYFCLAAHGMGIGSCWCGFGTNAAKTYAPLREFLRLRETDAVHAILFFGYPTVTYAAYPPRKPLDVSWL